MKYIDDIKKAVNEVKELKKSFNFSQKSSNNTGSVHVKAAASSIIDQVKKRRSASYVLDASSFERVRLQKSAMSSSFTFGNVENFAQERRHKDYILNYIDPIYIDDRQSAFNILYSQARSNVAVAVPELGAKPLSEQNAAFTVTQFTKLAFTDRVSDEILRFTETFEDYLINSAYAHLIERLTDAFIVSFFSVGTPFNVANYAGLVPSPTIYDLVHFMIDQYSSSSINADSQSYSNSKAADLVIIPSRYMTLTRLLKDSQNRYQFQPMRREDYFDTRVLEYNTVFSLTGVPFPTFNAAIVLNGSDVKIYIHRDIEVYMDRVVDNSGDNNTYRFTAEMYFAFVSYIRGSGSFFPIVSQNIPNDLASL